MLEIPLDGLGALELVSEQNQVFSEEEQFLLTTLTQIAQAVWKVLVEKDALAKQKEFYFLEKEIKARIQQTRSIDEALQVALQELSKALGFERAEIRLSLTPDGKATSKNE